MKYIYLLLCISLATLANAQDSTFNVLYKANVFSFFDNKEFAGSKAQISRTQAGTRVAPEVGIAWNGQHHIFVGVDAMHEWGSDKTIDYLEPIAYYEFEGKVFRCLVGAFPRRLTLNNYPRMFFKGSLRNYRPLVSGVFWEYRKQQSYFNLWLDWTSRQNDTQRETFFMGWSGRANYGDFYAQHFGYMHHFTSTALDLPEEGGLHDNGLVLTQFGIDLAKRTGFNKLEINAGWSVGIERDRSRHEGWHTPQGFVSEIKVEYKGVGIFNSYYRGGKQQVFASTMSDFYRGDDLYWGDPMYRTAEYDRLDTYIQFFKTNVVTLRLTYALHFAEHAMYHQQLLSVSFSLDNLKHKPGKRYEYLWDKWLTGE
ncbi:hypothetical protein FACS189452_06630 [Bacteroidia bacterium]|nr:hypothetical protein FACS189452_06630 [Bacteroidia bacterium]